MDWTVQRYVLLRMDEARSKELITRKFRFCAGGLSYNDAEEGADRGSMRFSNVVQDAQALALDYGQLRVRVPPE